MDSLVNRGSGAIQLDCRVTDAVFILLHANLLGNPVIEFLHVADDTHEAVVPGKFRERLDCVIQGRIVKRTEALVDEHSIELDTARRTLHLVGEAKGKGERSKETFAATEGVHFALRTVRMVEDVQFEPALAPLIYRVPAAHKFELPVGKAEEPCIRTANDPVEIRRLNVGFEHHLACAGKVAVSHLGKVPHPVALPEQTRERADGPLHLLERSLVLVQARLYLVQLRIQGGTSCGGSIARRLHSNKVIFLRTFEARREGLYLAFQIRHLGLAPVKIFGSLLASRLQVGKGGLLLANFLFRIRLVRERKLGDRFRKILFLRLDFRFRSSNLVYPIFVLQSALFQQFPEFRELCVEFSLSRGPLVFFCKVLLENSQLFLQIVKFIADPFLGVLNSALAKKILQLLFEIAVLGIVRSLRASCKFRLTVAIIQ